MTTLLHRFPIFEARSVEAAHADETVFGRMESFSAIGDRERFQLAVQSVGLGAMRLSAVRTSGHRVRLADSRVVAVLLPWRGRLGIDDGRGPMRVPEGEAALPRPGVRTTTIPGWYLGVAGQVTLDLLAQRAAQNPEDPWRPDRDWPDRTGGALPRYLRHLVADLDSADSLLTLPKPARGAADLFADLLLAAFAARAEARAPRRAEAGLRQVRRAEEVIRARLHEPLSVRQVAGTLGVGTRALQLAFRRHRNATPREVLAACRLEAARARLLDAPPDETVAAVALDCGISHFGRFAAAYRARFGETPSATLARARTRA